MLRIILIKPGTTDYDEQRRITGTLDVPLNTQGLAEVQKMALELQGYEIDHVYCSPCLSAWQTARMIAEPQGAKVTRVPELANLNQGLWQGKLTDEVKQTQPKVFRRWREHPETVCPPQGEMIEAALQRVHATWEKIVRRHKEGTIGVAMPAPLFELARSDWKHEALRPPHLTPVPGGCWEWIDANEIKLVAS